MRVLLIDVNCKHSSTGQIVYDLFRRLNENGHDAVVCYGRGELIKETGIYKFGMDWETRIHAALARITGLNGYYSFFSTLRLIKFIDKYKPDVIHIHELHAYFVNIKMLVEYIKKKKIKIVWTFHCEYMYTGKCGHANDCLRFLEGCGKCPSVRDYPKSIFIDRTKTMFRDKKTLLQDMDFTIITPSQWLADRVKMSFLKEKDIQVVYNGIDTENVFYPRTAGETNILKATYGLEADKIVLSVAADIMTNGKSGPVVLEICSLLPEVTFVLVGGDETKWVRKNVLLISRTNSQNELAAWYTLADMLLLCSKKETFAMPCAESLACGTQVVGFKCGAPETVFSEPYAQFLDYVDYKSLIKLIRYKLKNPVDEDSCRTYGMEFSTKKNYEKTLEIYSS